MPYEEYHLKDVEDVGIAFERETGRVWICVNGVSTLRVKSVNLPHQGTKTLIEFHLPENATFTTKEQSNAKQ